MSAGIRARLPEALDLAVAELAAWGFAATPRPAGSPVPTLSTDALDIGVYEAERPSPEAACRIGDERFLIHRAGRKGV